MAKLADHMALAAAVSVAILSLAGSATAAGPTGPTGPIGPAPHMNPCSLRSYSQAHPMQCDADVQIVEQINSITSYCLAAVLDTATGETRLRWQTCTQSPVPLSSVQRFHVEHNPTNGELRFRFGTSKCIFEKDWPSTGPTIGNLVVEDCGHASTFKMQNVTTTFELWTTYHPLHGIPKSSRAIKARTNAQVVQLGTTSVAALKMAGI